MTSAIGCFGEKAEIVKLCVRVGGFPAVEGWGDTLTVAVLGSPAPPWSDSLVWLEGP